MSNNQAKFDFGFLNKISGGDPEFILEMINSFKEMTPDFINNSKRFLTEANYDALGKEAHKFVTGASFLGMKHIEANLAFIEEYTKKGINLEMIPDLLQTVIMDIEEVVQLMNTEFNL